MRPAWHFIRQQPADEVTVGSDADRVALVVEHNCTLVAGAEDCVQCRLNGRIGADRCRVVVHHGSSGDRGQRHAPDLPGLNFVGRSTAASPRLQGERSGRSAKMSPVFAQES